MVDTMFPSSMTCATGPVAAPMSAAPHRSVAPPAVVRGWLHDRVEHWWALLVGAPPRLPA